jgi:hypothetical protein
VNLKFFTDSESHTTIFSAGPTPPTLAQELNKRLQKEAFPQFGIKGFFFTS